MHISISLTSGEPIYLQIREQVKNHILSGQLQEGASLPSIRSLAQHLKISVITTKRAYEELEQEGFVISVAGKGTYVSGTSKEKLREWKYREIEGELKQCVEKGKAIGLSRQELEQLVVIFYGEEKEI